MALLAGTAVTFVTEDATASLLLTFCNCCKRRRARDIVRVNGSVCRSFQDHLEWQFEWQTVLASACLALVRAGVCSRSARSAR